jgi:hypothetical protein
MFQLRNGFLTIPINRFEEKITVKTIEKFYAFFLAMLLLITLPLIAAHQPAFAEDPERSSVVFYVQ